MHKLLGLKWLLYDMPQVAHELLDLSIMLAAICILLAGLFFLEEALKLLSAVANVQTPDLVEVKIEVPNQICHTFVTLHLLLMMGSTLGGFLPKELFHILEYVLNFALVPNKTSVSEHQEEMVLNILRNLPVLHLFALLFTMSSHATYYTCSLDKNKVLTTLAMNIIAIFLRYCFRNIVIRIFGQVNV